MAEHGTSAADESDGVARMLFRITVLSAIAFCAAAMIFTH